MYLVKSQNPYVTIIDAITSFHFTVLIAILVIVNIQRTVLQGYQKVSMKNSKYSPSPLQNEENVVTDSLERVLIECLDRLKIKHNSQISKKAFESIEKINVKKINTYGKWIIAMNVIAESCVTNKHIFSQSEIYDFLTIAATTANLYPIN